MVNWYEKAKLEISKKGNQPTANTDEIGLTAVLAVPGPNDSVILQNSFGSNGSTPVGNLQKIDLVNSLTTSQYVAISSSQPCIAEESSSWLKKAKLEISKKGNQPTANTDEIGLTAVLAVPGPNDSVILQNSFGSNDSTPVGNLQKINLVNSLTSSQHAAISSALPCITEGSSSWLKKAKLEILKNGDRSTANTDEIGQTAELAVPKSNDSVILQNSFGSNDSTPVGNLQKIKPVTPMTANEHAMISLWLTSIGEDDSSIIDHVLSQCRADLDARNYFIQMASFATKPVSSNDDRRCCTQCTNLTKRGSCLAARRGEIVASRSYEPIPDIPRRCEGYAPKADDLDRRTGRERWFNLIHEGYYDGIRK